MKPLSVAFSLIFVLAPWALWADPVVPAAAPAAPISTMAAAPAPTPTMDPKHAPKITCANPNFDFGGQDEGPDIVHEFRCKNSGKGKLIVTNVSVSCGCTSALLRQSNSKDGASYPVTFAPGESFFVKATYHTSGRPGHATKVLTVASNDPQNPNFQLKFDVTVVRDVDVQPDRLYLYNLKKDEKRTSTIKILGKPGHPIHVLSSQVKNGSVTVTSLKPFEDPNDHRAGATLDVDVSAGLTIGGFNDEIQLKTDSPKKPEITISVLGEITGRVQFNPKNLTFNAHQEAPVTVTFNADDPKAFAIRSVSSAKNLTRPHILKTPGPNGADQYSVVVSCVRDLPKDSDGKDQVIVMTNDPEMTKIIIEVQISK